MGWVWVPVVELLVGGVGASLPYHLLAGGGVRVDV